VACNPGTYQSQATAIACSISPAGFYQPRFACEVEGGSLCFAGAYCPAGSLAPTQCPSGTYSFAEGARDADRVRLVLVVEVGQDRLRVRHRCFLAALLDSDQPAPLGRLQAVDQDPRIGSQRKRFEVADRQGAEDVVDGVVAREALGQRLEKGHGVGQRDEPLDLDMHAAVHQPVLGQQRSLRGQLGCVAAVQRRQRAQRRRG
jgi:hypothetical protein